MDQGDGWLMERSLARRIRLIEVTQRVAAMPQGRFRDRARE